MTPLLNHSFALQAKPETANMKNKENQLLKETQSPMVIQVQQEQENINPLMSAGPFFLMSAGLDNNESLYYLQLALALNST